MRTDRVLCSSPHGFHRMAYAEWGDPANRCVLLCVHGLNRNGRDFDDLARALADAYRVVAPDVVGRGQSDWLAPEDAYGVPQYVADMTVLLARLGAERVDWVGTSMGGLVGMTMAAMANAPVRRLVLNDVGPFIPRAALERIGQYAGLEPAFPDMDAAVAHFREIYAPFGPLADAQWRHLAETSVRRTEAGFVLRRDPRIADPYTDPEALADVDLWPVWDAIDVPVFALRGAESDLLTAETAAEMGCRGPKAAVRAVPGVGHAPALMSRDQIDPIREFLLADG